MLSDLCRPFQEIVVNSGPAPQAGQDQSICASTTTAKLNAATGTQTWQAQSGNPSNASIDAKTGNITGIISTGTYTFLLNDNGCISSVKVIKTKQVCSTIGWTIQQK